MGIDNLIVQPVQDLAGTIKAQDIVVGIIATPAEEAQAIARTMVEAGVKAILNYAPITLTLPPTSVCSTSIRSSACSA